MAVETLSHWDGPDGERWAAEAERYDRMSRRFGDAILEVLDAQPGEHVLDVGCGNGALTIAVAAAVGPDGSATGLDISPQMLAVAARRAREAALPNARVLLADAQEVDLPPGSFDALISRFGVMFFADPARAFANLARALRPGGRLVFTCWRDLLVNDWIMAPAAAALEHVPMPEVDGDSAGPFSLADPDVLRPLLDGAGFVDVELRPLDLPVCLGTDVDDALDFMQRGDMAHLLFTGVDPTLVERAWSAIRTVLETRGVELGGAVWLVTARAGG